MLESCDISHTCNCMRSWDNLALQVSIFQTYAALSFDPKSSMCRVWCNFQFLWCMQKTDWCIYVPLEGLLLLQVLLHTPQKLKVASNPAHWRLRIEIECCICLENCYLMISCSCMYVICHKIQACKKCFWKLIPFNSTSGWKVSPLVKTVCSFRDLPMVFTGRNLHCTRRIALIARCQKSNFWKKVVD